MVDLSDSLLLGSMVPLKNRIVMPPITRTRASEGDVPNELMATYYGQRASAGLIVTEVINVAPSSKGYALMPGIYTEAQRQGWRLVTDEVHRHGGTIFGPRPRDYSYKMNTKEKKAALKSALSRRVKEGKFVIVNDMSVDEAKTKAFALKMAGIGVVGKALLIDSLENKNAVLASRNNPTLNFVDALHVNVYDVVNSRYIVLSQSALDRLTEALSNER